MCLTGCVQSGTASCVFTLVNLCAFHSLPSAPPSQQKEKKVNMRAEEGHSIVLNCNPPQSSMQPIIHWMDASECSSPLSLQFLLDSYKFSHFHMLISSLVPPFFPVSSDHCYRFPGLRHIRLSDRVIVGKDGNLYFANLLTEDSRNDYTCNIQYLTARTILAKEPTTLTVSPCEFFLLFAHFY